MNGSAQLVNDRGRKYLTVDERQRFIRAAVHVRKPVDQTFVLTIAHTGAAGRTNASSQPLSGEGSRLAPGPRCFPNVILRTNLVWMPPPLQGPIACGRHELAVLYSACCVSGACADHWP